MNDPITPDLQTTALLAAGISSRREQGRWQPPTVAELQGAFPNIEVISLLGAGGMGAVYKGRQINLDRTVALKILASSHAQEPGFDERFAREARALARLEHPAIVSIHDFGTAGGRAYLVMQLIEGSNLRQVMATGALSGSEVLRLIPQLCSALAHAHAAGVVHRDLKPENILIDGRGDVHIADFGLAKLHHQGGDDLTGTGDVLGTAHYMAPEQLVAAAQVDHRADLYALGVIIYEMLTGSLPRGRFEPPSIASGVTPAIDDVVMRSLERDPERRFRTATELDDAVRTAAAAPAATAAKPAGAGGAGAAAGPTPPPAAKPKGSDSSVKIGLSGLHIKDGEDEVYIGMDGLHVRNTNGNVDIGGAAPVGPEVFNDGRFAKHMERFNQGGFAAGSGHKKFFSAGLVALLGGSAFAFGLALWRLGAFLQDPHQHVVDHRFGDVAMLATPVIIAGGVALLSRCCLPMALLGLIAEITYVPWLWTEHRALFWLAFLVPMLWQLHVVFHFHQLREHMASLPLHDRLLRLIWVAPIMGVALLAPILPWLHVVAGHLRLG